MKRSILFYTVFSLLLSSTLISKPFTPEGILPAGEDMTTSVNPFTGESGRARKGIVAATLNNVALLNKLLLTNDEADFDEIQKIREAVVQLLPSLRVVGIFNLFTVEEWISTEEQAGRIFAGVLYLKMYPEERTEAITKKLLKIRETTSSSILREEINSIL